MQDLNDKISGGTLTAVEWNEVPSEIQNVIQQTLQTLTSNDLNQLAKSIAAYAAHGDFYTDAGGPNTYVLTPIGLRLAPPFYSDGFRVRFKINATNTGASTVNVATLGVKGIRTVTGGVIPAGILTAGELTELTFQATLDAFVITFSSSDATTLNSQPASFYQNADNLNAGTVPDARLPLATTAQIGVLETASQSEVDAGTASDKTIVPSSLTNGVMSSFGINGFFKFPSWAGGFTIQWGQQLVAADSTLTFSWPIPFPTAVVQAVASQGGTFSVNSDAGAGISLLTATQGTLRNGANTLESLKWIALGH